MNPDKTLTYELTAGNRTLPHFSAHYDPSCMHLHLNPFSALSRFQSWPRQLLRPGAAPRQGMAPCHAVHLCA